MRTALIVLVIALFAPFAGAQLPTGPPSCGPLAVAQPTSPGPIPPGGETFVVVDVANEGSLAATVTVAANVDQSGWTVDDVDPAEVGAGQTGSFTFGVRATDGATENAIVTFAVSGFCTTPLGAGCPAAACDAAANPANVQATVALAEDDGFSIPGLENLAFPVEYLIAGIVLIALATAIPFAMRRKKAGIVAECPEPLKMVKPGRGTSFPIELRNPAKEPASATFEVGPVPEGWSAFMPLPEVQLAAREARSLWLMVRSPAAAAQGEAVDVELRLRSAGKDLSVVKVRAEVQGTAE